MDKINNMLNDALKAFHKANRELQFERNGGGTEELISTVPLILAMI